MNPWIDNVTEPMVVGAILIVVVGYVAYVLWTDK